MDDPTKNLTHRNFLGHFWTDSGVDARRYLSLEDRAQHVHVIGDSRTGKTELLLHLFKQEAESARGAIYIDHKGPAAERALRLVPMNCFSRVIYFNANDRDFPISFNLLANVREDEQPRRVGDIIEALRSLFGPGWGPRMQHILTFTLNVLIAQGDASFLGVTRMLHDDAFRERMLKKVRDPMTLDFWATKFPDYTEKGNEALPAIYNKIDTLMVHPQVRYILGNARNRLDLAHALNNRVLIVANLSGFDSDARNFLGSLLIAGLKSALRSRDLIPHGDRLPYLVLIDDFTAYRTDLIVDLLSDATGYGVSLVLAHQFLKQLEKQPAVRAAVLANAGTTIAFRVDTKDAEELVAGPLRGYPAEYYTGTPRHRAYCSLLQHGTPSSAFELHTPPPAQPSSRNAEHNAQQMIAHHRQKFGTPRRDIEERQARFLTPRPKARPRTASDRPSRSKFRWESR